MRKLVLSAAVTLLFATVNIAPARDFILGVGGRVGATLDPDQIHFGMHAEMGEIVENLVLRPNVEVGVGSDQTVVALNPEVVYLFAQARKKNYLPYAGGGLGLNIVDHNLDGGRSAGTDFEVGLNVMGGLQFDTGENSNLFVEAKLGVGDSPDVKFTFGFTLHR